MRALVSLFVLVAGCASGQFRPTLACPDRGGPQWEQYVSEHFVVTTDLSQTAAHEMVGELEQTYRAYVDIAGWHFPGRSEPPGRMRLLVFEREADYDEIGPVGSDAVFRSETVDGEPLLILASESRSHTWRELFLHELTHRMLRFYVPKAPLWLHEGLAEFYSTFKLEGGEAYVGLVPLRIVVTRVVLNLMPLLRAHNLAGWSESDANSFYAGAWLLVYVIAHGYQHELDNFLLRLAAGEEPGPAFADTFGSRLHEVDEAYKKQMHEWLTTMTGRRMKYKAPPLGTVERELLLSERDVHLMWAAAKSPRDRTYLSQIELSEKHGGPSARSQFLRGIGYASKGEMAPAERAISAAVDAAPNEERYRWALAQLHLDDALEHHRALDSLAPEMSWLTEHGKLRDSMILVARYEAERGKLVDARASVERALAIDTASAYAWDTLSGIAMKQGDIDGGIDAAERALHLAPHTVDMRETEARLGKLQALRKKRDERVND